MNNLPCDYEAARERYRKMRAEGKLSNLTQAVFDSNLQSIGLLWYGPPDESEIDRLLEREADHEALADAAEQDALVEQMVHASQGYTIKG